MALARYYLACIPEGPVKFQILDEQKALFERYGLKAMFNSPPHITLYRPFEWEESRESYLTDRLICNFKIDPFDVVVKGFSGFPRRVLFLKIAPNEELQALYKSLRRFMRERLGIINEYSNAYGFTPHITLAFRDLKPALYDALITEYKNRIFEGRFNVSKIWLLKHDRTWKPIVNFGSL